MGTRLPMLIIRCLLPLAALLIVACSNPKDAIIPTDVSQWDADLGPAVGRLAQDDRQLLVSYLTRIKREAVLGGRPVTSGVSVRQAIEEEREHQRTQTAQQGEARADQLRRDQERREIERQVRAILSITLVGKQIVPADVSAGSRSERATLTFNAQNIGGQTIEEIAGTIQLSDYFSGNLTTITLNHPESIPPGASVQWESPIVLSLFATTDQRLRNTDVSQLSVTFTPRVVRLADGTRWESATGGN